ncbi:unnamed protein product [Ectocarpus sp. 8 AP-2014]
MVETSPDGRFRYVKGGGSRGAAGTAYDTENGLLVGWNELNLRELPPNERSSMKRTIDLLQGLKHDHVLGVRRYWEASRAGPAERQSRALPWQSGETSAGEGERVVFLTTPCTTLEAFVDTKVEFLRWRVVKRWSRQILEALLFLHDQSPPVVHNTIYIDPSKSHLFVGGVCDIVAPPPATPSKGVLSSSRSGGGGGGGGGGGPMSWGNKAWGLVSGGGMSCGLDSAAADDHNHHRHVGKEGDDQSAAPEEEEEGEEEEAGKARDVRGFGTVVIEMILKGRLDPALAEDERFLEMLSVFSGWPESVVDLLRSCRAPINERPSAEQLLRHPFLELGNDLDDEAVYGDPTLVAAAFAAVHGHGGFAHQLPPGASLPVPLCPARCGGGGGGTTCSNTPTSSTDFAAWSSSFGGGGGGGAGHGHHTPSCVSTESPSPSSPSAAPSFGGVPTVPSSPAMAAAAAAAMSVAVGPFASQGGPGPYADGGGGSGYGLDWGEEFSSLLPAGVTPAAYANAKVIAARMQHAAHAYSNAAGAAPFHHPTNVYDDDGQGEERVGRNRSASTGGGMRSGGSRSEDTGIGGYGFGVSQREEGGGGSAAAGGRPRSASEDAVWDMLPSDESQCRRPFSVSAVEGRHGY